jgi:F-type H+-transporting ATPase subunit epsilon
MALSIEIVSPTQVLYRGEATEVLVPSVNGETGILSQHADYITLLEAGDLVVKNASQNQNFQIAGGVAKVEKDKVLILVEEVQNQ